MTHSMTTLEWEAWVILAGCSCGYIVVYRPENGRIFIEDLAKHTAEVTRIFQKHASPFEFEHPGEGPR